MKYDAVQKHRQEEEEKVLNRASLDSHCVHTYMPFITQLVSSSYIRATS